MYLKRIKKLFTDVVSHHIVKDASILYVELETTSEWNENTARAFQFEILDRNPEAFGGPFSFICKKQGDNYIVKWNCYDIAGY